MSDILIDDYSNTFTRSTQTKITKGVEAWERIKTGQTWKDWLAIGEAIAAARKDLMDKHGFSNDVGARWNEVWAPWLKDTGFDKIDAATRSTLQKCVEHKADLCALAQETD